MSPKLKSSLDPERLTAQVISDSIRHSLILIREKEQCICDDTDTECLHDYRVIIRSIRAILGRIKHVFPTEIQQQLQEGFSTLGHRTNLLRDLDVYLSKEETYRDMVPDHLRDSLAVMFDDYRRQRETEFQSIRDHLLSEDYNEEIARLAALADDALAAPLTSTGKTPITSTAKQQVKRQLERVVAMQERLLEDSTDDSIHRLRLQCKKLRYLLEYFTWLYDRKLLHKAVRSMKTMQDTLGEYNDLSIQQGSLQAYQDTHISGDSDLALAIGTLVDSLHERQIQIRDNIAELLETFNSKGTQQLFRKLAKSMPS